MMSFHPIDDGSPSDRTMIDSRPDRISQSTLFRPSLSTDIVHVQDSVVDVLSIGGSSYRDQDSLIVRS